MPSVIVPFKGGARKSRLSGALSGRERDAFSLIMLRGVLEAVAKAGLARRCWVVTSEKAALAAARELGANPVRERTDAGVNSAVRRGEAASGGRAWLVVPADLPLVGPSDLRAAIGFWRSGVDVVLAPSKGFDGTNLLLYTGERRVRLSYDRDSFWNHLSDASRSGYSVAVYTGRGVVFDVDSLDDLRALGRVRSGAPAVSFARGAAR